MNPKRNDTDAANATTRVASLATTTTTMPLVAYEFPCSYLGKPRAIKSSLLSSLLGTLKPPVWPHVESNDSSGTFVAALANTTATQPFSKGEDDDDDASVWLSCPRRTIDGIASETILESKHGVASLQSNNLKDNLIMEPISAPALAVEVWFTPLLEVVSAKDAREDLLLPIVSIAESLASASQTGSSSRRHDPCERTQLMIGQRGEFLELVYRDHYEYLPESFFEFDDDDDFIHRESDTDSPHYSCRVLQLTQWKLGDENVDEGGRAGAIHGLHHMIVAWKDSGSVLQIFGNGKSIVNINLIPGDEKIETNADADFVRHWDPSFRLQLFSDSTRWFETSDSTDVTERVPTSSDFNNTNDKGLFSGAIHKIALYKQDMDEQTVKNLYKVGVEKRNDPFQTFFGDPANPFEPLQLVASLSSSTPEEEESNNERKIRGLTVTQGSSILISVGASELSNTTTALWDVLVEIVNLPRYGDLVYYNEKKVPFYEEHRVSARVGDTFLLEEESPRIKLEYQHLEEDYFSVPKHSYNGTVLPMADLPGESFSYRLIATKKRKMMIEDNSSDYESLSFFLGQSEEILQELTIVHKNHPPILVDLPKEVKQPEWQPSGMGARPWATLGTDVVLNDGKDHDIDRVRLDLWANEGTLTINLKPSEIRTIAEITDCSNPSRTGLIGSGQWICDGKNDRNMTLLATPTDVSRILSNLQYKALHWDTSDSIVLRIYDGSGGLCPGKSDKYNQQQQNTTIVDECYSIATFVEVPPLSRQEGGPSSENIWRDHWAWWISLVVLMVILSTTCCCAIACWRRCRRIKKLNDIAVSDNDNKLPSVVLASPEGSFPSCLEITEEDRKIAANHLDHHHNQRKDESPV